MHILGALTHWWAPDGASLLDAHLVAHHLATSLLVACGAQFLLLIAPDLKVLWKYISPLSVDSQAGHLFSSSATYRHAHTL